MTDSVGADVEMQKRLTTASRDTLTRWPGHRASGQSRLRAPVPVGAPSPRTVPGGCCGTPRPGPTGALRRRRAGFGLRHRSLFTTLTELVATRSRPSRTTASRASPVDRSWVSGGSGVRSGHSFGRVSAGSAASWTSFLTPGRSVVGGEPGAALLPQVAAASMATESPSKRSTITACPPPSLL
jgi:hypothetical protein